MGAIFSPPSLPTPPPAPAAPPPMPDVNAIQNQIRKQNAMQQGRPMGAIANELSGEKGDINAPNTATKTLLGQ